MASSVSQVWIMTRYSLLNYVRARRFLVMVLLVTLINLLLTVVVGYTRTQAFLNSSLGFYGAWWGGFIFLFVLLIVVFFGGDAISGEFQNKTGYYLAPNPVRRSAIYVGKYLAAGIASTAILLLFAAFTLGNGLYYGFGVPTEFIESFAFAWVALMTILSFTFMFSSVFKNSALAILLTIVTLLLVFNIVDTLTTVVLGIEPWYSIIYGSNIVTSVLSNPYPAHYVPASANFGIPTYVATIPEGLAIVAVYFVASALVGLYLFEKKEFT
jgi:ABC-2 type transport system permease protein